MTFADFLIDVPGPARLLICIALYVGFSLLAVRISYDRAIALARAAGYTHRAAFLRRKFTLVPF